MHSGRGKSFQWEGGRWHWVLHLLCILFSRMCTDRCSEDAKIEEFAIWDIYLTKSLIVHTGLSSCNRFIMIYTSTTERVSISGPLEVKGCPLTTPWGPGTYIYTDSVRVYRIEGCSHPCIHVHTTDAQLGSKPFEGKAPAPFMVAELWSKVPSSVAAPLHTTPRRG